MKNKKILYVVIGIAVVSIVSILIMINNEGIIQKYPVDDGTNKISKQESTAYTEMNKIIKQKLSESNISMSSPIKLQKQEDIKRYCSFFTSEEKQKLVQYCTSTELKDEKGNFLGNIHMVGSYDEPKIILVLIQVDPFMSQIGDVKTIIDTTIQNTVCDCWNEVKPGNLQSTSQWIDGLKEFHLKDTRPHSQSNEITLRGKVLQLELTTNKDGYLWQFFIYN